MTAPTKIARQGYQNFGSFMGDNVQDLIAVPAVDYTPPPLPFAQPPPLSSGFSGNLGDSLRSEFFIDFNSWTFVNHGAFGGVCRAAQAEAALWRDHCEAQPLSFIDRELFPHVVRVIREMAEFVGCRPADLVFVSMLLLCSKGSCPNAIRAIPEYRLCAFGAWRCLYSCRDDARNTCG